MAKSVVFKNCISTCFETLCYPSSSLIPGPPPTASNCCLQYANDNPANNKKKRKIANGGLRERVAFQ